MAKAQAQWGKHKFLISSNQLNPMGDFSTSSEAKASDSKSKKKKTELETYTLTDAIYAELNLVYIGFYSKNLLFCPKQSIGENRNFQP